MVILQKQTLTKQSLKRSLTPQSIKKLNIKTQAKAQQSVKQQAQELDNIFSTSDFGSVEEFNNQLNSIPANIRNQMTITESFIINKQKNLISEIERQYELARKREKGYNEDARESNYIAKKEVLMAKADAQDKIQEVYKDILKDVNNGQLYNIDNIKTYARQQGLIEYDKSLAFLQGATLKTQARAQAQAQTEYEKALKVFSSGESLTPQQRKDVYMNLAKLGFTGNAITNLVNAYETSPAQLEKIKNAQFDSAWGKLSAGKTTVDKTTFSNAYKTTVNQELSKSGFKTVSLNSSIEEFEKAYNNLLDRREQVKKSLTVDVQQKTLNDLAKNINSIENKVRTGQTITPQEMKLYNKQIELQNNKLTSQQIQLAKKIFLSPVNYGKYLKQEYDKGNKKVLINNITDLLKGVKSTTIDPMSQIIKSIFKTTIKTEVMAYNYGYKLGTELKKGNLIIIDDLKKIGNNILKGAKITSTQTKKIYNFVKNNKKESALIVGLAVVSGLKFIDQTGKQINKLTYKKYNENPAYFLGQAIGLILPIEAVAIGKGIKGLKTIKESILKIPSSSKHSYKIIENLVKGESKIQGTIKSKNILGKQRDYIYNLKVDKTKGIIKGRAGYKTAGDPKVKFQYFNLEDKGLYYKDIKTGEKIYKKRFPIKNQSIKITEQKITPIKQNLKLKGSQEFIESEINISSLITTINNNTKKVTKKITNLKTILSTKDRRILKGLGTQISKQIKKKVKLKDISLTQEQIKAIERLEKNFFAGDNLLYSGLDRRELLARILGLRKENNIIKNLYKVITKEGSLVKRKGILKASGTVETKIKLPKLKFKPNKTLRKNKKGSINLFQNNKIEVDNVFDLRTGQYRKRTIEIPELKTKLPLNKNNIKLLGIEKDLLKIFSIIKIFNIKINIKNQTQLKQYNKKIQNKIKELKKEIIKTNIKIKKQQKKIQIKKPIKLTKTIKKPVAKKITRKVSRTKTPTIKEPLELIKPRIFPLPKINFDNQTLNNRVVTYEAIYRERKNKSKPFNKKTNPIITKKIIKNTTKNRMLKIVAYKVDNSLVRSMEIKIKKISNKKLKDIKKPNVLNKFNQKKSKNTPVLRLVEKSKSALDTIGEKKEAQLKKRQKKTTSKRVYMVSNVKKNKKSSRNGSKRIITKKSKKTASKSRKNKKK